MAFPKKIRFNGDTWLFSDSSTSGAWTYSFKTKVVKSNPDSEIEVQFVGSKADGEKIIHDYSVRVFGKNFKFSRIGIKPVDGYGLGTMIDKFANITKPKYETTKIMRKAIGDILEEARIYGTSMFPRTKLPAEYEAGLERFLDANEWEKLSRWARAAKNVSIKTKIMARKDQTWEKYRADNGLLDDPSFAPVLPRAMKNDKRR